jgi:hypothetical protein
MKLNLKAFSQLVEDMAAALQSSASALVDVSVGSVVRAVFEANASVVLWLQWLVLQVLQTTRAATSSGTDLDSWMADFGQSRLLGVPSTGIVTFSRFATNLPANVPVGAAIKTSDGSLTFTVTQNQLLSTWNVFTMGYQLPSGVSSADLPVTCTTGGSIGNVLSGTLSVIAASLPGIDQVNNVNPLSNGADAESDQVFRQRFQSYLASRSRATLTAISNAISNVRQGLDVCILENTGPNGAVKVGFFLVVVDDGTGYPSTDLLSAVGTAVDFVRPIGTMFAVVAPAVMTVNATLTVVSATSSALLIPTTQSQIATYLDSLPIGKSASITRVAQSAYLADPSIENVINIQLNGLSADIVPPALTVIKSSQVVITVNAG